jgi:hypothetical protein
MEGSVTAAVAQFPLQEGHTLAGCLITKCLNSASAGINSFVIVCLNKKYTKIEVHAIMQFTK